MTSTTQLGRRRRGSSYAIERLPEQAGDMEVVAIVFERLGRRALALGSVAYFLLLPLSRIVPSLTSIVASVATM